MHFVEPEGFFFTFFTRSKQFFLSWSRSVQSTNSHPVFLRFVVIFSPHLLIGLPSCFFPSGYPTKTTYALIFCPIRATRAAPLIIFNFITKMLFYHQNVILWGSQNILAPYSIISSCFLTIIHKYLSQNYVLQWPRPVFFLERERPSFTPNKATCKILILYILIFIFTDSKRDGKRFWTEW